MVKEILCKDCKHKTDLIELDSGEVVCKACEEARVKKLEEQKKQKQLNEAKIELARLEKLDKEKKEKERFDLMKKELAEKELRDLEKKEKEQESPMYEPISKPISSELIIKSKESQEKPVKKLSNYKVKDEEEVVEEYVKTNGKKIVSSRTDLIVKISVVVLIVSIIAGIIWFNSNFGVYAQKNTVVNVPVDNNNQNNFTINNQNNISPPSVSVNVTTNMNTSINFINPVFNFYGNNT
jgi:hypothetical protein